MIACVDVHYQEEVAWAAGIVFNDWADEKGLTSEVIRLDGIASYEPGQFYRRELPCLLAVLNRLAPVGTVIVDSYVWLESGHPGLGARLHESLGRSVAVVGVAKTRFRSAEGALEVYRGTSERPLYVSAMGMTVEDAAEKVKSMHGEFRTPTLLRQVDRLCRDAGTA